MRTRIATAATAALLSLSFAAAPALATEPMKSEGAMHKKDSMAAEEGKGGAMMKKDEMKKEGGHKDSMSKDSMGKDSMGKH